MHQSTLMALGIVPVPERLHSLPLERPDIPTKKVITEQNERLRKDIEALLEKDPSITASVTYHKLLAAGKIPITRKGAPMTELSFNNKFYAVPKSEDRRTRRTDKLRRDIESGITDIKVLAKRNQLTVKYVHEVVNCKRY